MSLLLFCPALPRQLRLEVTFKENCERPVLAYHLAGDGVQLGAYSAQDSNVFFSGYK